MRQVNEAGYQHVDLLSSSAFEGLPKSGNEYDRINGILIITSINV